MVAQKSLGIQQGNGDPAILGQHSKTSPMTSLGIFLIKNNE